jgi:hypothetical protein
MDKHTQSSNGQQVEIIQSETAMTRYAGAVAWQQLWHELQMPELLVRAAIHYGQAVDKAAALVYALTLGPLVEANSVRSVAQRIGGEASPQQQEADALLCQQVEHACTQRTFSRFVNKTHDWLGLHSEVVGQLQQHAHTRMAEEGVIVIDDMPIPKPYARQMDYLSTIYDPNRQCYERGYLLVHLYYYHPDALSYSVAGALWHKSSLSGETAPKPANAMRRAHAHEEQSKLDMALAMLEMLMPRLAVKPSVVFDSWYCARWFVAALTAHGFAWISQASSQRKFAVEAGYFTVPELIERYREQLAPVIGLDPQVRAVALDGIIPPDKYTRHAQPVQLLLVQDFFAQDEPGGVRLLLCNQRHWSPLKILTRYGYRSKIEAAHRNGKQLAAWGEFHSRSWPSLQAHCALALLRSLLLTLLAYSRRAWPQHSLAQILYHCIQAIAIVHWLGRRHHIRLILPRGQPAYVQRLFDLSIPFLTCSPEGV